MAQLVERVLGKDEVTGSNPVSSFAITPLFRMPLVWQLDGRWEFMYDTIDGRSEAKGACLWHVPR